MTRLVVVGGGIAGLAAAWFAAEAGLDVTVLEAAPRVGGKLRVEEVGGVPVDVGAEALLTARPEGLDLLAAAGLADERISPLTTSARVWAGGTTHPLPARTMMGIPGDVEALRESGALSDTALQTVAEEPSLPPLPPLRRDVPVGSLVRYRMGDEVADRLVEPLLGGVYAGSADVLSLRATMPTLADRLAQGGSLLEIARAVTGAGGTRAPGADPGRPVVPVFASLRGGLGRLPATLVATGRFAVRTGVTVRTINRSAAGFTLDCGAVPQAERIEADAVIVAVPAAKAARLLAGVAPAAGDELGAIESASMAIVSFALDGDADEAGIPAGSGLLIGAGERFATKAVTLTSRKWPVDADGRTVLRASVGRHGEPHALQLGDADLVEIVRRDLGVLLGDADTPRELRPVDAVVTRWGGGLPQYAVGHVERIARVRAAIAGVPGLAACGAAFDGVGVPACIASARSAVDLVAGSLSQARTMRP
ncbi:oxygen-dependent protoporphyrinogen oxidase [Jatrophihabitans endophyticus]|uniref:Coproporphyrinogen III oxidase n=1 Tax=Jatrophihabitans endophyticus TaxID=1206085 RepID=A0A1M5M827_9ACTN|nr:protoporphyrinogen oxidase [Jatrophihabitans endophyticus]SHG73412.1 oxygen-dependent protoporphyrinogen oxidase [Jatrophihabitans endophyticus]